MKTENEITGGPASRGTTAPSTPSGTSLSSLKSRRTSAGAVHPLKFCRDRVCVDPLDFPPEPDGSFSVSLNSSDRHQTGNQYSTTQSKLGYCRLPKVSRLQTQTRRGRVPRSLANRTPSAALNSNDNCFSISPPGPDWLANGCLSPVRLKNREQHHGAERSSAITSNCAQR